MATTWEAAVQLSEIDLCDPANYVERFPYELFDRLRREDPVHWTEDPRQGVGFWAITKYDDVVHVSRHAEIFSSQERSALYMENPPNVLDELRLMMLNMDPPGHTRLRAIVNKGFTPRMVGRLEARIREYANAIVDRAIEMGSGDFVRWIAAELPLEVIAELMGAPLDDRQQIFELSNRLVGFDDPEFVGDPQDSHDAAMEMYNYADKLYEDRMQSPRDDIVSKLAHAEVEGHKLEQFEFDLFFMLLSVAGNETTRNAISGGMLAFFEHPEQWERLRADRSLITTAAEEIVRWTHPVNMFRRTAMADTEIRGQSIAKGDKIVIWYPSANRDEDIFDEPYSYDIGRDPNPQIGFGGGGPHFCLGAHLARLEIQVMFDVLTERLPDIEQAGAVKRLRSYFLNGIKELPVRFAS
jgi:cholest-4-en-3-one 26-monooxygenase